MGFPKIRGTPFTPQIEWNPLKGTCKKGAPILGNPYVGVLALPAFPVRDRKCPSEDRPAADLLCSDGRLAFSKV